MKFKSFIAMMVAAMAIVIGVSSCSSDDDNEPQLALASQVTGSYTGDEVITVMGEPEDATVTYQFAKTADTYVDMTIPEFGDSGMMMLPALTVKNIPLSTVNGSIVGRLDSYTGTVVNAKGEEKAFTVTGLVVIFEDVPGGKAVAVTYSLKYGSMPMEMVTTFNGNKN